MRSLLLTIIQVSIIIQTAFAQMTLNRDNSLPFEENGILFTSALENTIGIQWNFGSGEGQIVLSQYNFEGVLECLFVNIQINEGEGVDLNCAFSGYPAPSVTWVLFQNGQGKGYLRFMSHNL